MRINPELKLRKLGSHYMIVDTCADNMNLTNVYVLNSTAAWLWEKVVGMDFSADTLISLLCDTYEVGADRAATDVALLLDRWVKYKLLIP